MLQHLAWKRGRQFGAGAALLAILVATTPASAQNTVPADGYAWFSGLRINGADQSNTVYHASGNLLITTEVSGYVGIGDATHGPILAINNGRVGVGMTNPSQRLDVTGGYSLLNGLRVSGLDTANTIYQASGNIVISVETPNYVGLGDASNGAALAVKSGNVGIGTTNPAARFHVAGNAQVDGNIAAKYQDIAEWVRTSSALSSGTIVAIDTQDTNRVVASNKPFDTRVAGVVSRQPGIVLGEPGEGKAMIAHSGRVRVKVDANYGSIAVGDLLVTSPTPGYAMRSEPVNIGGTEMHRPGTLIGKALEPLSVGQAEILVLLTLQ